jgi:hypothetical protein
MHRIAHSWPFRTVVIVAAWRSLSELLLRRRELASTGELALRVQRRRADRIEHALVRAGLRAPVREAVLVPVAVGGPMRNAVHATVQVGSIHGSDLDDVGLLEAAMRRTAAKPPLVTYIDETQSSAAAAPAPVSAHGTAWGDMLGEENVVERFRRLVVALASLPLLAMILGVTLTFYPLMRPLDDVAPWFAVGGLAFIAAGVLGARWSRRHDDDDLDDDSDDWEPAS